MNSKKANITFLAITVLHIVISIVLSVYYNVIQLNVVSNFILSQLIVLIPISIAVVFAREKVSVLLGFRRIKITTVLMTVLFTFLMMPLVTLVNAVSMLFVDNTVAGMAGDIMEIPFPIMLLLIGVIAPISEEIVFRGVFYQSYKKSGTAFYALLFSAILFALMHMNINQAAYALVIGIVLVMLNEAAGSIWGSVIFHIVFNSQQVMMMYAVDSFAPGIVAETSAQVDLQMMLASIGVYIFISSITTVLAGAVLIWIAKNQKREESLRALWESRKTKAKEKMVTIPVVIAVVCCLFYMSLELIFKSVS